MWCGTFLRFSGRAFPAAKKLKGASIHQFSACSGHLRGAGVYPSTHQVTDKETPCLGHQVYCRVRQNQIIYTPLASWNWNKMVLFSADSNTPHSGPVVVAGDKVSNPNTRRVKTLQSTKLTERTERTSYQSDKCKQLPSALWSPKTQKPHDSYWVTTEQSLTQFRCHSWKTTWLHKGKE